MKYSGCITIMKVIMMIVELVIRIEIMMFTIEMI